MIQFRENDVRRIKFKDKKAFILVNSLINCQNSSNNTFASSAGCEGESF